MAQFEVTPRGTVLPHLRRENHMKILRSIWELSVSTRFSRVQCPVLLMPTRQRGEGVDEERLRHKEEGVAQAQRLLPTARTVWMEDSIHDVQLQRPEAVVQIIADASSEGFFLQRGGMPQVATPG